METSELNRILRKKAIEAGLCKDWQENVWNRDLTIPELLQIYIKGFDFSLEHDWIDYDFIKKVVSTKELHEANIYIDEHISISEAFSGTWVFLGECEGTICFRGFSVGTVYVRHNSNIEVITDDFSKAFVSIYDESEATLDKRDYSTIRLYDRRR